MTIFLFFPDFCMLWNGISFSKRGGAWLLPVTPPLLGRETLLLPPLTPLSSANLLNWLIAPTVLVITTQQWLHRIHHSSAAVQLFPWEHICLRRCHSLTTLVYLLISWSLPSNRSTCYTALSLRLFVPNSVQAYHYFFSNGCACDVCDCSHLPPHGLVLRWLLSNCSSCSLLKVACSEWLPHKVPLSPGITSSSFFYAQWK
jgi:hypothetical protein